MTLREKVLQTFIVTIREINKHGGPTEFFDKYPVGGMYFWNSQNPYMVDGKEYGTALSQETLELCRRSSKSPLLVCADSAQIQGQKNDVDSRSLAGSLSADDSYNYGKLLGMQMNANHIDWVLGPTVDMYYNRSMPFLAMSDDPKFTAKIFSNVVKGIQEQGVCATVKHFPGLGTSNINMHFGPGQNTLSFDEWMSSYGYVYKEMFKQDVYAVMTTHTTLKSYDSEGENGYYPIATYSHKLTTKLLKEELGFKGVVVTDALIMGGMATGDIISETVQAFKAGADLLLWPPVEAADKIVELIENGDIPISRLEDALSRIERMREFRKNVSDAKNYVEPNCEFADAISSEIIKNGICLLKNDINLIPLNNDIKKILIVDVTDSDDCGSSQMLCDELNKCGKFAEVKRNIYDVPSRVCWQDDIDKLQSEYELVIFNVNTNYATSWNVPFMLIWASHLFNKEKKLIINYGSPFFSKDYFPEDPTIIEANSAPSKEAVHHLADGILGNTQFAGQYALKRFKMYG